MLENKTITIIGLGLLGGSLAKALKKYLNIATIYTVTFNENNIKIAIQDGIITKGFNDINHSEVLESDFIFLCTPVKIAIDYLKQLSTKVKSSCIITDVCSTKGEIVDFVNELPNPPLFVGGHPMAGKEHSGYLASSPDLFLRATYILSRAARTDDATFSSVFTLVEGIGALGVELSAGEQDMATATISHLPHIIAFNLVDFVRELDEPILSKLAAGGFKDITRIASSDANMWENIFTTNKLAVLSKLDAYINKLKDFRDMIANDDSSKLQNLMINAKSFRDSIK